VIPASQQAWRPVASLPLQGLHPAAVLTGGVLAMLSALLVPAPWLLLVIVLLGWLLIRAGWRPAGGLRLLRLWAPLLLVVLAAHAVSAADAAAVGRPSWTGLGRGLLALVRLGAMLAAASLTRRSLPLAALSTALAWWLRPLRWCGLRSEHLNVVLAVAVSTAPRTLAEARRLQDCLRLRRADGRQRRRGLDLRGRWLVVPPLMEGLVRRAETLPLAVAGRIVPEPERPPRLPLVQALGLLAWVVVLFVIT
jgi:energy-coupling factor transporter transmembrane protein EcfT